METFISWFELWLFGETWSGSCDLSYDKMDHLMSGMNSKKFHLCLKGNAKLITFYVVELEK